MPPQPELDIARGIRTIEWLKVELLGAVTNLYRAMFKGSEEVLIDALSGLLLSAYLLARRLGVHPAKLDLHLEGKLREKIGSRHELEEWYGDFSALLRYLESREGNKNDEDS